MVRLHYHRIPNIQSLPKFQIFVRGCSHITSAKIRGFWTPPLSVMVSIWPIPPRQQWSAFGLPPLPPPAADVICEWPLMPYSLMTSCSWEISSNLRYGLSSDTRVPTLGLISGPVKEVRFFDFRFLVGEDGLGLVRFPNPHYVVVGKSD